MAQGASPQAVDVRDRFERFLASTPASGAVLALLAAVPVGPTLFAPFLADDYLHIDVASHLPDSLSSGWVLPVATAGAWWTPASLSVEYFRPLIVLFFALDHALYGNSAAGYHLTNLLAYAATTLLVWGIARHVLGAGVAAWAAAALFAIHPCHAGAVDWISGRTDVLAGAFYAGAFLLYLESRRRPHLAALLVACALLTFGLGLLSKEMAITLPAVMLLHALLFPQGQSLSRRLVPAALAGVVGLAYLALRVHVLGGFHPPPEPFATHVGDPGFLRQVLSAPLLYLGDLVLFVMPDPMVTFPFWMAHLGLFALFIAIVLVIFRGTVARAPTARQRAWGLGWMALTLLPVATLTVGEHFLFVPSVGYCLLVGSQLPLRAADVTPAARRGLAFTAFGVLAVALVRTVLFDAGAAVCDRAVMRAVAALDQDSAAETLLVADVPAGASLTLPYAVHLARPGRPVDVQTLSISPHLLAASTPASEIVVVPPDRLRFTRADGFLRSYVERALRGPHEPFVEGQTVDRGAYTVTVLHAPGGVLHAFDVTLRRPDRTLVLRDDGSTVQVLAGAPGPVSGTP